MNGALRTTILRGIDILGFSGVIWVSSWTEPLPVGTLRTRIGPVVVQSFSIRLGDPVVSVCVTSGPSVRLPHGVFSSGLYPQVTIFHTNFWPLLPPS